jgi:hypothetical protein
MIMLKQPLQVRHGEEDGEQEEDGEEVVARRR